ncbi:hypothetical protein GG681_09105 [Epibacterium sp. SM1969]|uniref:Phage integrase family protein n=1 Tax=Tritonibacter aquimaris TaxID=2663379 RepID=A0A844ATV6_9RHOB|nr:hypothetical protein [Tritonibacter aquimaris]MQY42798.1 hypothetical protein [Tritonibacter aquimaris]
MIEPKTLRFDEFVQTLPRHRQARALDFEAYLPGSCKFEDDSWNTWSWGKHAHRTGTVTIDFSRIANPELRVAIKLLVLHSRATRRIGPNHPIGIVKVAALLSEILGARLLTVITNSDIQNCERAIIKSYKSPGNSLRKLQKVTNFLSEWFDLPVFYRPAKTSTIRHGAAGSEEGRRQKLISDEVLAQILHLRHREELSIEDRFFVHAFALNTACGFRVSELLSLPEDCLLYDEGTLFVRSFEAKGGLTAPRLVPSQLKEVVESAISEIRAITDPGRQIAKSWASSSEPDWPAVLKNQEALEYFTKKFIHFWTADPRHKLINPDAAWHFGRAEWIDVLGILKKNRGAVNKTTNELSLSWDTFQDLCAQQEASRKGQLYARTCSRSKKNWLRDQRVLNQYKFFQSIGFASGQKKRSSELEKLMLLAFEAQAEGRIFPLPDRNEQLERDYARERPVLLKNPDGRAVLYVDEALMVIPKRLFGVHQTKTDQFKVIETSQFIHWLGGRAGQSSIFDRFRIIEPQTGEVAKFTSHDIRHWLNTAYHRGGLTQVQIATLFNRHTPRGNSPYNQMTNEERREAIGHGINNDAITGHISDTFRSLADTNRNEAENYLQAMTRQLNVMPHGLCAKDLVTDPCPHHLSCFSCQADGVAIGRPCSFLIVDKADTKQLREIRRIHDNAAAMLEWLEEDEMTDTPQFKHFKTIMQSTAALLCQGDSQ